MSKTPPTENLPNDSSPPPKKKLKRKMEEIIEPSLILSRKELNYFRSLPISEQLLLNMSMESLKKFTDDPEIPLKFHILKLPVSEFIKSNVMKKIQALDDDSGEHYKLKNWIDSFLKIPFGKIINVPVSIHDGREKCSKFLKESRILLDKAVFGMTNVKTQIMQILSQWITNPNSGGNVIALKGPAGVGKTSIAKNGISKALCRPFEFFSLGGSSDISNFIGHSYTYEGSICGRIVESLMHSKCMNPIMYFDELDKISGTPHGEEVSNMLIHLIDRTQNSQFHDRYFSGIDFDLSKCLFVFSFNEIQYINPILKDRMQIIECSGYTIKEKQVILHDYVWPDLLERLEFKKDDILLTTDSSNYLISEYSSKEEGIRNLIRSAEMLITRLNMLRIADEETMKVYDFYISVEFPLQLNVQYIKKLLFDTDKKEYEPWRTMYN